MKLYYTPGACSLAPHIVLCEGGISATLDKVALDKHMTAEGQDFYTVNPQGSVPTLELDGGEVLTENAVILQYLATQAPDANLAPKDGIALWRMRETLNFIATELHKGFSPLFRKPAPEVREGLVKNVLSRLKLLSGKLGDKPYLMGAHLTVPDAYAYVMLRWAKSFQIDFGAFANLTAFYDRMQKRPGVQKALSEEGLPTA
ncbi:MAG: glutathione transferase GstA [Terricaulis sp.]